MNEVQLVLKEIKHLIDTPDKWCKGQYARDENDEPVSSYSNSACKFCLVGAKRRVVDLMADKDGAIRIHMKISDIFDQLNFNHSIEDYNDVPTRTHADIMNFLDKAIEVAGKDK